LNPLARDDLTAPILIGLIPGVPAQKAATLLIARAPECRRSVDQGGESYEGSDAGVLHIVLVYDSDKSRNLLAGVALR
jgi:hypothetical protein